MMMTMSNAPQIGTTIAGTMQLALDEQLDDDDDDQEVTFGFVVAFDDALVHPVVMTETVLMRDMVVMTEAVVGRGVASHIED